MNPDSSIRWATLVFATVSWAALCLAPAQEEAWPAVFSAITACAGMLSLLPVSCANVASGTLIHGGIEAIRDHQDYESLAGLYYGTSKCLALLAALSLAALMSKARWPGLPVSADSLWPALLLWSVAVALFGSLLRLCFCMKHFKAILDITGRQSAR